MLPKRKRLSAIEVTEVLTRGRSVSSGTLSLKYIDAKSPKISVVVAKSVARDATERNRVRRAAYRALAPLFPTKPISAVLFVRSIPEILLPQHLLKTLCFYLLK